jgi:hypothetical protein
VQARIRALLDPKRRRQRAPEQREQRTQLRWVGMHAPEGFETAARNRHTGRMRGAPPLDQERREAVTGKIPSDRQTPRQTLRCRRLSSKIYDRTGIEAAIACRRHRLLDVARCRRPANEPRRDELCETERQRRWRIEICGIHRHQLDVAARVERQDRVPGSDGCVPTAHDRRDPQTRGKCLDRLVEVGNHVNQMIQPQADAGRAGARRQSRLPMKIRRMYQNISATDAKSCSAADT